MTWLAFASDVEPACSWLFARSCTQEESLRQSDIKKEAVRVIESAWRQQKTRREVTKKYSGELGLDCSMPMRTPSSLDDCDDEREVGEPSALPPQAPQQLNSSTCLTHDSLWETLSEAMPVHAQRHYFHMCRVASEWRVSFLVAANTCGHADQLPQTAA
ncbi:unnamed protein product [Vitrella brassicaformis CCMP3155]|uniref:Uncharacterized protein n=1 Tax=Vitrella brassicaformis (strain CCMP3155) TaxID=1169540 RepID=A0A0G4H6D5_VITBC|nr:unnamed protein product [Vitrella brassicaformis CCMP3155]|eukprot:CEM39174.1 unnamed protein product [Vitrella brassicaformis CCMP3155]